jgi:hypothetical protein
MFKTPSKATIIDKQNDQNIDILNPIIIIFPGFTGPWATFDVAI